MLRMVVGMVLPTSSVMYLASNYVRGPITSGLE
jgi:hypothetical protein